jgi:hypothetical protein
MQYIPQEAKGAALQRMKGHDDMHRASRLENYSNNGGYSKEDPDWNKPHKQARQRYTLTPARLRRMGIGR